MEIVRRLAAAFNDGSIEAMRPLLDPELVWHEEPFLPDQFLAEFSAIRYEQGPGETVEAGDNVDLDRDAALEAVGLSE